MQKRRSHGNCAPATRPDPDRLSGWSKDSTRSKLVSKRHHRESSAFSRRTRTRMPSPFTPASTRGSANQRNSNAAPSRDATVGLLARVRGCTRCADVLPVEPRPVLQASANARTLIASQGLFRCVLGLLPSRWLIPSAPATGRRWLGSETACCGRRASPDQSLARVGRRAIRATSSTVKRPVSPRSQPLRHSRFGSTVVRTQRR
jgi:hypothetical protein